MEPRTRLKPLDKNPYQISDSGKLRKRIGRVKGHLIRALESYSQFAQEPSMKPELMSDDALIHRLQAANKIHLNLTTYMDQLKNCDDVWIQMCRDNPLEVGTRQEFIANYGDYKVTVSQGTEAITSIREMIIPLRYTTVFRIDCDEEDSTQKDSFSHSHDGENLQDYDNAESYHPEYLDAEEEFLFPPIQDEPRAQEDPNQAGPSRHKKLK